MVEQNMVHLGIVQYTTYANVLSHLVDSLDFLYPTDSHEALEAFEEDTRI